MELIVANTVDAYRESVALIQDPVLREHEIRDSYYIQDRALLWRGGRKVVVTSLPVEPAHLRYLQEAMGYARLENLSPREPTDSLCADVLREGDLRAAIVARLRGSVEVRLIPFVAQPQVYAVAEALRQEGIAVTTPECPPADLLWVRDYLDSKAGFRRFFASIQPRIEGLRLPEGGVAQDPAGAARLAARFLDQGRACLCKPNNSQGGVGFLILQPGDLEGDVRALRQAVRARLEADSQMRSGAIVVEELIAMDRSVGGGSPSLEMCVPSDPARDVEFTYLCGQILTPSGYFYGVEMYDGVVSPALQHTLKAAGLAVAREVRRLGYVGIFDLDLVAGTDGELYAVEINTRRTGGTHAHEAAEALLGPRYWERAAVICNNELAYAGPPLAYAGLQELLRGLLFPVGGQKEGIVPTIVTSLPANRFGYLALGPNIRRTRSLERDVHQRLIASGRALVDLATR